MRRRSPFRVPRRSPRRSSSRSAGRSARAGRGSARGAGGARSPSVDSQRHAGMPNASASLTKSGFVKSTPKWRPNFLSCFQTIEPYWRFSQITLTIGVRSRTAVSSSCTFIRKPPSPLTVTTWRSGCTSLAAIAVGSAKPMPGQAVGDEHRVGLLRREHARDPQLVQADVGDRGCPAGAAPGGSPTARAAAASGTARRPWRPRSGRARCRSAASAASGAGRRAAPRPAG